MGHIVCSGASGVRSIFHDRVGAVRILEKA
jgi:hypothetical protein